MASRKRLTPEQIDQRLQSLSGWAHEGDRLRKRFVFDDFVQAFGWMSQIAIIAETMNHHPDWKNVYKTVDVELWTHDAGGLTELDFELAAAMDRRAPRN